MVSRSVLGIACGTLIACSSPIATAPAAWVTNASRTTACAEEDNVYVKLSGRTLTGMRIEARQPSYISQLTVDDSKADFTDCHFSQSDNPVYHFEPQKVVLWEDERWLLIGNTYESFWRPDQVDVVVQGRVTHQLHLLQLHLKEHALSYEFLVLYPPDGYWRAKPIPPRPLTSSTYGTSFLVGPVKDAARPVVELAKVEFVPEQMTFQIDYRDGSHGAMHIASVDRDKLVLDYQHSRALPEPQPLAAIRSMFVSVQRSDVAEVSFRVGAKTQTQPLPLFTRAPVTEVRFGRSVISKHNPSAPDMWFGGFVSR